VTRRFPSRPFWALRWCGDDRLKPIAEIMFSDFFAVCFDYIANEFPKAVTSNGQVSRRPLVVRTEMVRVRGLRNTARASRTGA
jgi:pyruvate/2-oxoglutarate/acetoin dehydrogenase E1 component